MNTRRSFIKTSAGMTLAFGAGVQLSHGLVQTKPNSGNCKRTTECALPSGWASWQDWKCSGECFDASGSWFQADIWCNNGTTVKNYCIG
jgi:hypothetical protein